VVPLGPQPFTCDMINLNDIEKMWLDTKLVSDQLLAAILTLSQKGQKFRTWNELTETVKGLGK